MTLFLRTVKNKTVVEIEVSRMTRDNGTEYADFSVAFDMFEYTSLLAQFAVVPEVFGEHDGMLSRVLTRMSTIAADAENINEIRGWYFEAFLPSNPSAGYRESLDAVREKFREFGNKYKLRYAED